MLLVAAAAIRVEASISFATSKNWHSQLQSPVASTAALMSIPEPSVRITSATIFVTANFPSATTGGRITILRSVARFVGFLAKTAASIGGYMGVSLTATTAL